MVLDKTIRIPAVTIGKMKSHMFLVSQELPNLHRRVSSDLLVGALNWDGSSNPRKNEAGVSKYSRGTVLTRTFTSDHITVAFVSVPSTVDTPDMGIRMLDLCLSRRCMLRSIPIKDQEFSDSLVHSVDRSNLANGKVSLIIF